MNPSLTVVVPLHNSQSSLPRLVEELLEVTAELSRDFEIVLVDDGSTDSTIEVAQELSLSFPQVLLLVHPMRLGAQECLRSALRYSRGDVLLAVRNDAEFDPHELPKLWAQRTDDDAVVGQWSGAAAALGQVPRPPARAAEKYAKPAQLPFPDLVSAPRRILIGWLQLGERPALLPYLKSRGYRVPSVVVRPRRTRRPVSAIIGGLERRFAKQLAAQQLAANQFAAGQPIGPRQVAPTATPPRPTAQREQPKGPSYLLSRLRAFARGE